MGQIACANSSQTMVLSQVQSILSEGDVQKSNVLSDNLNYKILRGCYGNFYPMTPKINCPPQL